MKHLKLFLISLFILSFTSRCSSTYNCRSRNVLDNTNNKIHNENHTIKNFNIGDKFTGKATYYNNIFEGRKTANGEIFSQNNATAAHRYLPFGTKVKVTNLINGKIVILRINDRGPFGRKERIIDVSLSAAKNLDMVQKGVIPVQIEIVELP